MLMILKNLTSVNLYESVSLGRVILIAKKRVIRVIAVSVAAPKQLRP